MEERRSNRSGRDRPRDVPRRRPRDDYEDEDERPRRSERDRREGSARRRPRHEDEDYNDRPRRRRDEDDYEDRPRRRSPRRRGGIPVWVWIVGGSVLVIGAVVVVLVLVLGGGNSVSNYEKVQKGWTRQQVIDLLGKPEHTSDRDDTLGWKSGDTALQVQFRDGKVFQKYRGKITYLKGGIPRTDWEPW